MMMVANAASDGMGRPQDAVVHALHTLLSETELDIATLTEIEPATLQRCIQRNSEAKQLVRFMVIIVRLLFCWNSIIFLQPTA